MAHSMPDLHVDHNVTISIKTRDWNPSAQPMVGFSLQITNNIYVVATAPASSDGQTVSVTMKIPHINGHGPGPWPCALRIAYCAALQPDGFFIPNPASEIQPIALGKVYYP